MDLKNIQPEATITVELAPVKTAAGEIPEPAPEPQLLTFRLRFLALDEVQDYPVATGEKFKLSKALRAIVTDGIVGWENLQDNGKDVPCTAANKDKYLPVLLGLQTKLAEGETEGPNTTLVRILANFAGDANNFLKN